jgi:hypothetical protein
LTIALSIGGRKLPTISTRSGASHLTDRGSPALTDSDVTA